MELVSKNISLYVQQCCGKKCFKLWCVLCAFVGEKIFKISVRLIKREFVKSREVVEISFHSFLPSALRGDEWLASRCSRCKSTEIPRQIFNSRLCGSGSSSERRWYRNVSWLFVKSIRGFLVRVAFSFAAVILISLRAGTKNYNVE